MQALSIDAYQYEHSPIQEGEFRLARLQPAAAETDPIRCRIVSTANFTQAYEALSYVWRDARQGLTWANIEVNGDQYKIPQNLYDALQSLRLKDHERSLWVDAICINQNDLHERAYQVSMMKEIFQNASRVCVWLGTGDESSRKAMQFIQKLGRVSDLNRIIRDSSFNEDWIAVLQLICLPWFSRIWVVQEIAVARKAKIWCGSESVDWDQLESCVSLLVLRSHISTEYSRIADLGAVRLVDVVNQVFRRNELGEVLGPSLSLEVLVTKLAPFQSASPHDRIFALLGLANDTGMWQKTQEPWEPEFEAPSIEPREVEILATPRVGRRTLRRRVLSSSQSTEIISDGNSVTDIDYSKPFSQLCDEFVSFAISKSGSLDILFQPWAPEDSGSTLSSWICTVDRLPFRSYVEDGRSESARLNADPLVSPSGQPRTYNASGKSEILKAQFSNVEEVNGSSLRVMGMIVDSVSAITDAALGGNMPMEWLRFGGTSNGSVSEEFWHTLVAGRGPDNKKCPPYYSKAVETTLHEIGDSSVIDLNQIQSADPGSIKSEFWSRAQSVIWNRSLIRTGDGKLGLVPPEAEIGDSICIIFGCSVPVVLRQSPLGTYQLVGESYIHGMMEGEVLELPDQDGRTRWLDIESKKIGQRAPQPPELMESSRPIPITTSLPKVRGALNIPRIPPKVPTQLEIVPRQFRLYWTCSCGFQGVDTFMEYRAGAIDELAKRLEDAGVSISLEPLGLSDPFVDTIKMLFVTLVIFFTNLLVDLDKIFRGRANGDQVDETSTKIQAKPAGNPSSPASSQDISLGTLAIKGAQISQSSSKQPSGQSSSSDSQSQAAPAVASASRTARNRVTADYLLLCIDDSEDLTTRDDLDLTTRPVASDQQLFSLFRTRYFSRRNWIHKYFSLKSLQSVTFVKFTLHENQEVDGFQPDQLPYSSDRHYRFLPRPPGTVPPFSSKFLRHRFKDPGFCRDSTICLEQVPKRIDRRPDRGQPPDMFVGWGLYLQDGFSGRRIGFGGLLGIIVSLVIAIVWWAKGGSISDIFAILGCVFAVEFGTLAYVQFVSGLVH